MMPHNIHTDITDSQAITSKLFIFSFVHAVCSISDRWFLSVWISILYMVRCNFMVVGMFLHDAGVSVWESEALWLV